MSLFIHGFNARQLGYTLEGVPRGDQQYRNYNGPSPRRAIISEDIGRVAFASGRAISASRRRAISAARSTPSPATRAAPSE